MPANHAVLKTMQTFIVSWEQSADNRAIFLTCYSMMTGNMVAALEQGEFEDRVWVSGLLQRFAQYYFDALHAYDGGGAAPEIWRFTFEAARTAPLHVLQNLLLGVNAHICYDLVFALADQLQDWGTLSEAQRAMRYRDHCHVNEIIYATINRVQDEVVARHHAAMMALDFWMGPLDEWLLHRMIAGWRDEVWNAALRLLACSDTDSRAGVCAGVESRTLQRASAIAGAKGVGGLAAIF